MSRWTTLPTLPASAVDWATRDPRGARMDGTTDRWSAVRPAGLLVWGGHLAAGPPHRRGAEVSETGTLLGGVKRRRPHDVQTGAVATVRKSASDATRRFALVQAHHIVAAQARTGATIGDSIAHAQNENRWLPGAAPTASHIKTRWAHHVCRRPTVVMIQQRRVRRPAFAFV